MLKRLDNLQRRIRGRGPSQVAEPPPSPSTLEILQQSGVENFRGRNAQELAAEIDTAGVMLEPEALGALLEAFVQVEPGDDLRDRARHQAPILNRENWGECQRALRAVGFT